MNSSEVLGLALNRYFDGQKEAAIIVQGPDFEPDIQPVSYYFREYSEMPEIEKEAIKLSRGKILDIGSAAGSHCLELQKMGMDVTGLELSPAACKLMSKRGVRKILNQDIFDPAPEKFDTLLMLMNGIGLVQTTQGLSEFLKHIKNFMNAGAQLLFDSANLVYLMQDLAKDEMLIDLSGRYYGEIEFVMEFEEWRSENFFWLYIDFDTLCFYAEKEGFRPELIMQDKNFQYLARLIYL